MNISQQLGNRLKDYKANKERIDKKKFKYIPFDKFNKLSRYLPGIIPGIMYKITSHSGMGKTQLSKYLFVFRPLLYALNNNLKFRIIYISPEETKEEFLDSLVMHVVKAQEGVTLNRYSLSGYATKSLSQNQMQAIFRCSKTIQGLGNYIEVIDDVYTADAMYEACKQRAEKWGKFDSKGNYTPNDPDEIVLVVCDHISLIEESYDEASKQYLNLHKSISKWHTKYAKRIITKKWNWAVLNVQQQSLDSAKEAYTNKGHSIVSKVLPTVDGLGDNRVVARDDYVVIGLFSPWAYGIENYKGYKTDTLKDNFRSLHLLKNRFGPSNKVLPMWFDGSYTYFEELPGATDPEMSAIYSKL